MRFTPDYPSYRLLRQKPAQNVAVYGRGGRNNQGTVCALFLCSFG